MFQVTQNEYENCHLNPFGTDPLTRRVISCNNPYDVMKYTLSFRAYLPVPNGFEFRPNHTYYFLSTSSTHHQCSKLKILVYDHRKFTFLFSHLSSVSRDDNNVHVLPHCTSRHIHIYETT